MNLFVALHSFINSNVFFRFIPFLGHTETDRENKFVNFTEENGRHIVRPSNCKNNIYLYGGSTTFGYNVTDNQTLGFYLQKLVDNSTCVFNHGRAYYYSKQENNLLKVKEVNGLLIFQIAKYKNSNCWEAYIKTLH